MIKNIMREWNEVGGREEDMAGQESGQVSSSTMCIFV